MSFGVLRTARKGYSLVSICSLDHIGKRTYGRNGISIQVDVPTGVLHTVHTNGRDKTVGNDL